MSPLWSGAPGDPEPPRRHARLYEAEYAKQLRRIASIREAVGNGETLLAPRRDHRSWDEPPAPAPRHKPPEEESRPAGDPRSLSRAEHTEPRGRRTDAPGPGPSRDALRQAARLRSIKPWRVDGDADWQPPRPLEPPPRMAPARIDQRRLM